MNFKDDPSGAYATLILVAFVLLETSFRMQLVVRDSMLWALEKIAARNAAKAMTARMTAEEKMLSEYMIG
jgi:hypothetical protein